MYRLFIYKYTNISSFSCCFHFLLLWEEAGEWKAGVVMW